MPALNTMNGIELLVENFSDHFFPKKKFKSVWPTIALLILKLAKSSDDAEVVKYRNKYADLRSLVCIGIKSSESDKTSKSKKKNGQVASPLPWTATTSEALESFIVHIEDVSKDSHEVERQITFKQNELLQKYKKHLLELTSYVMILGPIKKVQESIVVIGTSKYLFTGPYSPVTAIDACFKATSKLQKEFAKASSVVWQYIRRSCYEIDTPSLLTFSRKLDNKLTSVEN